MTHGSHKYKVSWESFNNSKSKVFKIFLNDAYGHTDMDGYTDSQNMQLVSVPETLFTRHKNSQFIPW